MNADDMKEFRGYLKQCTDRQVQGVYDHETQCQREDYAELALAEAERRGIELDKAPKGRPQYRPLSDWLD